ncbi:MAG: hypothetical protein JNK82_27605 [Myxococcaceae bacterium]|nr:hypothetical protein [Myxococcaceae bacterium]
MSTADGEFTKALLAKAPKVPRRDADAFWGAARAAHPKVNKPSPGTFAAIVAEQLEGAPKLSGLHAADLYLSRAALASDPAGVAAFRVLLERRTADVLGTMRVPGTLKDEVVDQLFEKMLVTTGSREARLSTYAGRGELAAWLGAAATRTAIELKRLKRYADDHASSGQSRLQIAAADPELQMLNVTHSARFKKALHEAFRALGVEDRNLLRMQLADQMTVDQLADIFQIHRATAARRAARARQELVKRVREVLQAKYRMSEASIASDLRALGGNMDLSLSRLLAPELKK